MWGKSLLKELGRLAQGVPGTAGTDTIVFIKFDDIPIDRRGHVTYGKTVVMYRPEKADPNRSRLTVGGNRIVYPGDVSTPTVEMMTVKMHLNSVISTKGARYCTFDIKDFYLMTPMERPEFMRMKLSDLPPEFVTLYDLTSIAEKNGTVYIKVQKGMYGLPQAGILAQQLLEKRLNAEGYRELTKPYHTRTLETRHTPYLVHTMRRRFWGKIRWPRTRGTPKERPQHKLHVLTGLGWKAVFRNG